MKYAVIGLGNLGRAIAQNLTRIGHEIVGIDYSMPKIELIKQEISSAVCIDSVDPEALSSLSLEKLDGVFITYGKDFGISVQTAALLKNMGVKNIIVRSISPLHQTVLTAIGIKHIMTPEQDFATDYALNLITGNRFEQRFNISEHHAVFVIKLPQSMINETVGKVNFITNFKLSLITIKRKIEFQNLLGLKQWQDQTVENINEATVLKAEDSLVLYGSMENLRKFENL
ncbi:MAG: TrkA family potassium uptake protein [Bacteroidales bacterium]